MSAQPIGPRAYDPSYAASVQKAGAQSVSPAAELVKSLSQEEASALEEAFGTKSQTSNRHVNAPDTSLGRNIDISA